MFTGWRVVHPSSMGAEAPGTLGPHPTCLFLWLSICVLSSTLVSICKCVPVFCEWFYQMIRAERGAGERQLCSQAGPTCGGPREPILAPGCLEGLGLEPAELGANSGWPVLELDYRTPSWRLRS